MKVCTLRSEGSVDASTLPKLLHMHMCLASCRTCGKENLESITDKLLKWKMKLFKWGVNRIFFFIFLSSLYFSAVDGWMDGCPCNGGGLLVLWSYIQVRVVCTVLCRNAKSPSRGVQWPVQSAGKKLSSSILVQNSSVRLSNERAEKPTLLLQQMAKKGRRKKKKNRWMDDKVCGYRGTWLSGGCKFFLFFLALGWALGDGLGPYWHVLWRTRVKIFTAS